MILLQNSIFLYVLHYTLYNMSVTQDLYIHCSGTIPYDQIRVDEKIKKFKDAFQKTEPFLPYKKCISPENKTEKEDLQPIIHRAFIPDSKMLEKKIGKKALRIFSLFFEIFKTLPEFKMLIYKYGITLEKFFIHIIHYKNTKFYKQMKKKKKLSLKNLYNDCFITKDKEKAKFFSEYFTFFVKQLDKIAHPYSVGCKALENPVTDVQNLFGVFICYNYSDKKRDSTINFVKKCHAKYLDFLNDNILIDSCKLLKRKNDQNINVPVQVCDLFVISYPQYLIIESQHNLKYLFEHFTDLNGELKMARSKRYFYEIVGFWIKQKEYKYFTIADNNIHYTKKESMKIKKWKEFQATKGYEYRKMNFIVLMRQGDEILINNI